MSSGNNEAAKLMWILGYAGLIPFYFLLTMDITQASFLNIQPEMAMAQYAAVIVSFLGAIHWGQVVATHASLDTGEAQVRLIWSVIPSIVAWGLLLINPSFVLLAFAVLVAGVYMVDRFWLSSYLRKDYLQLRLHLSTLVFIALMLANLL
jgi:hypothetical protein